MKTKQYFKYSRLFFLLLVIGTGLMSCEDEDKYGKTATDSAKAVIESVRVMENEEWTPIVQVRIGTAVRIEGNNLENVSAVYFNGYEVVADDFTNFGKTYIEATVPEETPIGHQVADEAVKNTVRVVTDINEFTSALNIISKSLNISGIALYNSEEATVPGATTVSEAELGSKIQIQGAGLDFVTAVYFNGKQTEEKFISQSAGGITLHIPNDTPLGTNVEADADRNTITVETEFGEKFIYSFVIKGNPPTLAEVRSADGTEIITVTRGGETICLIGTHLETVTSIHCNGKELTDFDATSESILLALPTDLPVGSMVTDESVKNKIRIVSEFGEATLDLIFRGNGPVPVINRVSHTLAKAGERIELLGDNFIDIEKVVFPGEVAADLATMRVSEDCKTLSILIPSGGDQTTGAIKVEGINGVGYSYSYINCKDNVFIAKFNSDNWDTHKEGKNISSNLSLDIGKSDDYPTNPDVYRAYPATGPIDYVADASSNGSGYYKFVTKNAWQHLLTNGALSATIMCADLAVQIDCYMSCTWAGGAIRFGFTDAKEFTFTPWHKNYTALYKDVDVDFSKGWKTVTIPLSELNSVAGKTVADAAQIESIGQFTFIFGQFSCNEKWSYGSAMSDFRIYFGNFRIVPYTKPIIE